jgi:diadenosine tetraphosphate (Ap4A) HIT family hydrolase
MSDQPTFVPNTDVKLADPSTTSVQSQTGTQLSVPAVQSTACPYCPEAPEPPLEQFYETKLFRVVVSRKPLTNGHVIIIPKNHDPHFYRFDLDQLEEFGYLIKKVSFIAMRQTNAPGFTLVMSDGAPEVADFDHLEIHIIPRQAQDTLFQGIGDILKAQAHEMDDAAIAAHVTDLKNLMQLPQDAAGS